MDPKESPTRLGERLRNVRKKRGESLRDIEERSGLNNGYLSQLENDKISHPSPAVLQKVATGYRLRFQDLLQWTGYVEESQPAVTTNQAVALSSVSGLGEPSDEELQALQAIIEVLQKNRAAGFTAPSSDQPLDPEAHRLIRGYATSLLREADALGARPTPLDDLQAAAQLVLADELTLDPNDKARLRERFGHWVNRAWRRLQGTFDFRTQEIWVKPDIHPMKRRFVISHEIGHAILPAHKETFAYVDDFTRLPPLSRDLYEREANQAAAEILFQGGQATEEFDSSEPSLAQICRISASFGASIVATARYIVEGSRRPVAVVIAHRNVEGRLGRLHVYASARFRSELGWVAGDLPTGQIRAALATARDETEESWVVQDRRHDPRVLVVQKLDTSYAAILFLQATRRPNRLKRKFGDSAAARAEMQSIAGIG